MAHLDQPNQSKEEMMGVDGPWQREIPHSGPRQLLNQAQMLDGCKVLAPKVKAAKVCVLVGQTLHAKCHVNAYAGM